MKLCTQAIHLNMTEGVPSAHEEVRLFHGDRYNRLENIGVTVATERADNE